MTFPLEELIKCEKNMYEVTCAASKRAYQLSMYRPTEYDIGDDKVVSLAAREIFSGEVDYKPDNETEGVPDLLSKLKG